MNTAPEIIDSQPRIPPPTGRQRHGHAWINVVLFVLTFLTALSSQVLPRLDAPNLHDAVLLLLREPERIAAGLPFALTLLAILLAHEMGHYLTARRYGVDQSLPYFIPAPTLFGTFGAVILMRSQPPNRGALLNVAVAGPFAGLLIAIPAAAWGLYHSVPINPAEIPPGSYWFGSSLLFHCLEQMFSPNGTNVMLHDVGLAGWVGLFLTSLNLIPAAQLDGGHVAYALLGVRQHRLARVVVLALVVFGLYQGANGGVVWLVWAVLLVLIGLRHPPTLNESAPLTKRQRTVGWLALAVFVLTFIPAPVSVTGEASPTPQLEQPLPRRHPRHDTPELHPPTRNVWPEKEYKL